LLLLIECLLEGECTYLQTKTRFVFLLGDSIESVNPTSTIKFEGEVLVALIDADKAVSQPANVLVSSLRMQVIATSSPKKSKDRK
jgi:hypothetical protein